MSIGIFVNLIEIIDCLFYVTNINNLTRVTENT